MKRFLKNEEKDRKIEPFRKTKDEMIVWFAV